ncbi:MAG TPA: preprotein translocase subunit SecY [Candidatus Babeliales bacterium]|nr:preprotein translocase subunit SecY [Candidatus Babeliales bacterium]
MIVLKNFINIFFIPELRKKLLFTLGVLIVYQLGVHIPVIGIDVKALTAMVEKARGLGGLLSYLDMFSGGALKQATLFGLGIMPYITASIMMQMLSLTVPSLEQLQKEGEYGRKIINQYTRYLAFFVSIFQATSYVFLLERNNLVLEPGSWLFRINFVFSLTVASMFVMWLGEQISLFGLGNGSSMIIFAGIVARLPDDIIKTVFRVQQGLMDPVVAVLLLVLFVALAAFVVFVERGERKIPVQYTRRVVGQRVYGAQSTYIPFKVNTANIMPVILTGAVINIPLFATNMLADRFWIFQWLWENLQPTAALGSVVQFLLIIMFSFVYTALIFNPDELADNMKKGGGFIPGIRPGKQTASYFNYILTRLGLVGALYLATLALLPNLLYWVFNIPFIMTGTALLIVVGVGLDTAAQIESYLIENRYEGFLSTGRLKGRMIR